MNNNLSVKFELTTILMIFRLFYKKTKSSQKISIKSRINNKHHAIS